MRRVVTNLLTLVFAAGVAACDSGAGVAVPLPSGQASKPTPSEGSGKPNFPTGKRVGPDGSLIDDDGVSTASKALTTDGDEQNSDARQDAAAGDAAATDVAVEADAAAAAAESAVEEAAVEEVADTAKADAADAKEAEATAEPALCSASAAATVNATGQTVVCPAGCGLHAVTGTAIYATESSICSAAIHAGLITAAGGGSVKVYLTGKLGGAFQASTAHGIASTARSAPAEGFAFTVADGVIALFRTLWIAEFGPEPDMPPIDAKSLGYWNDTLKTKGCVAASAEFIRSGVPFNPWNTQSYIDGVRGVGPHNSSYNLGFMKMIYEAVFGFVMPQVQIDYFLPKMDDGTYSAMGITDYFLADHGGEANCAKFGF